MYRGDIVLSRLSPTIMYVHGSEVEGERLLSDVKLDTNESLSELGASWAPKQMYITHA